MLNQVVRYAAVVGWIEELRGATLLDVGSGSESVAGWLGPGWHVTAVDRSFEDQGAMRGPYGTEPAERLEADIRRLPLAPRSFDVVLALDLLEHLAPSTRRSAVDDLVRLARRRVIVSCPTGGLALAADRRLHDRVVARGLTPPAWLREHVEHGFPDRGELHAWLDGYGTLRLFGCEHIRAHESLMRLESRRPGFHASAVAARAIARSLRRPRWGRIPGSVAVALARGLDREPTYRTVAVLDLR